MSQFPKQFDLFLLFFSAACMVLGVVEILRMLFSGGNPPLAAAFFFGGLLLGVLAWVKLK